MTIEQVPVTGEEQRKLFTPQMRVLSEAPSIKPLTAETWIS